MRELLISAAKNARRLVGGEADLPVDPNVRTLADAFAVPQPSEKALAASEPSDNVFTFPQPSENVFAASEPSDDAFAVPQPSENVFAASEPSDDVFAVPQQPINPPADPPANRRSPDVEHQDRFANQYLAPPIRTHSTINERRTTEMNSDAAQAEMSAKEANDNKLKIASTATGSTIAPAPLRTIIKAEAILRQGYYWMAFEFDDGSKWTAPAASKLHAEFETRDRIGDTVLLGGSPLLRRSNT